MADTAILPEWAAHYVAENLSPHMHVINVLPVDKGPLRGAFLINTSKGAVLVHKAGLSEVRHWLIPLPGEHVTFQCQHCNERMDLVDPDVPRTVYCSNCGHEHFLVVRDGKLAIVEGDGPTDITDGYTLYKRGKGGDAAYFFAKSKPRNAKPADLPDGATVEANPRTGVPEVRLPEAPAAAPNYYAYRGPSQPVQAIEGIGDRYADKLAAGGIETTARLLYEDVDALAKISGAPKKTAQRWQAQAELMLVKGIGPQYAEALARSGVGGVADLKAANAATLATQVAAYLDSLDSNVLGTTITERRVQGWQRAASTMRKVRSKVPEA